MKKIWNIWFIKTQNNKVYFDMHYLYAQYKKRITVTKRLFKRLWKCTWLLKSAWLKNYKIKTITNSRNFYKPAMGKFHKNLAPQKKLLVLFLSFPNRTSRECLLSHITKLLPEQQDVALVFICTKLGTKLNIKDKTNNKHQHNLT